MTDATARFGGFAQEYDRVRPQPPAELVPLLTQWSGAVDPEVVDLGAGTGLSTVLWPDALGVEPDAGMRAVAATRGGHRRGHRSARPVRRHRHRRPGPALVRR